MKLRTVVMSLLLAGGSAGAQTRVVEGVVVRSDDHVPIAGVEMQVRLALSPAEISATARSGGTPPMKAVTDARGRFTVSIPLVGRYRLSATAPGFGTQYFGSRTGVLLDESAGGLVFALRPVGTLTGHVRGTDGAALAGIDVTLMHESYGETGTRFLRGVATSVTNDRGEYRFADIEPARYYVRAQSRSGILPRQGAAIANRGAIEDSRYISPTFYPGVATSSLASLVEVRANAEVKGIDIISTRAQTFRIRGSVIDTFTQAAPAQQVRISWFDRDSLVSTALSPAIYRNGSFELTGVFPGRYRVSALLLNTAALGQSRLARADVEVIASDAETVQLAFAPLVSLNGRLIVEDGALPDLKGYEGIRVVLNGLTDEAGSGIGLSPSPHSPVSSDGRFTFKDFVPDEYTVLVSGLPDNVYLKAIRYGNADVLSKPMNVPATSPDTLEVLLSLKAAQFSGLLTGDNSKPLSFSEVVLLPAELTTATRHLHKRVTTNAEGAFSIRGITPGTYRVFGWPGDADFEYFDPTVRSEIELAVPAVSVSESSNTTVRATVFRKN